MTKAEDNAETPEELLVAITERPAYKEIFEGLGALKVHFIDNNLIFTHVKGASEIMASLAKYAAALKSTEDEEV